MTDVLVARGGFADDAALLRLHHAAGLSLRTVEANLAGVQDEQFDPPRRSRPACVVFAAGDGRVLLDDEITRALTTMTQRYPDVAFVAVVDAQHPADETSRTQARVELLDAGADEVVCSQLAPRELAARVSAVIRRVRRGRSDVAEETWCAVARPRVDIARRELIGWQSHASLTAKEATVMDVLVGADGVVDRDELGSKLWTGRWCGTAKAIDMHVANLRRKLADTSGDHWRIETVRGVGFMLVESKPERATSVTTG